MTNPEETRRIKAMNLRYKKPIAKGLNLDDIRNSLWDISEACGDVQYYIDSDDETLLNALDGDEDDAYEFKMMFSTLSAECEQMQYDLGNEYIPEYFDLFFAAVNKGGEMLGFDTYEGDYYGLGSFESTYANEEAVKKIKVLTKDKMIETMQCCFRVYQAYIGLTYRYDCIKSAMDILRSENTSYLKMIKEIEELYENADGETEGFKYCWNGSTLKKLDRLLENVPQEAWIQ
ncbi:hypothetical protein D7V82_14595 [bacterium 1xD8-6]|nr:hypothetical protein D7V72_16035 [bacterium D16-36]RKI66543.1 hypothetical protein D7V82_14595 [bacterium 1xD8-6]